VHFGCSNHQLCNLEDKALHLEAAYAVEVGSGTLGFRDQMSGAVICFIRGFLPCRFKNKTLNVEFANG
jgi:hypothetical protein